jgi:hypothetical protein
MTWKLKAAIDPATGDPATRQSSHPAQGEAPNNIAVCHSGDFLGRNTHF